MQEGYFDQVLGILIGVEDHKMVSHLAQVLGSLMMSFVVGPPVGHRLLVSHSGGGLPHVVCSPALLSP